MYVVNIQYHKTTISQTAQIKIVIIINNNVNMDNFYHFTRVLRWNIGDISVPWNYLSVVSNRLRLLFGVSEDPTETKVKLTIGKKKTT